MITLIICYSLDSFIRYFTSCSSFLDSLCIFMLTSRIFDLQVISQVLYIIVVKFIQKYAFSQFNQLLCIFYSNIIAVHAQRPKLASQETQLVQDVTYYQSIIIDFQLYNGTIHLDCVTLYGTRFQTIILATVVLVASGHHIVGCSPCLLHFTLAKKAQHDLT